jgi:hypothetical protein
MTKEEKIQKSDLKLQKYIDNKSYVKINRTICNNEDNISGFLLGKSNNFIFMQATYDFMFDCYAIIRKDDYNSIRHSSYERTQRKIYKAEGLLTKEYGFDRHLPLMDWEDIFGALKKYDFHVIIENINEDYLDFWIGEIVNVTNKNVEIHNYDPDGILDEKPKAISFDSICTLKFGDRYSTIFRKYIKRKITINS